MKVSACILNGNFYFGDRVPSSANFYDICSWFTLVLLGSVDFMFPLPLQSKYISQLVSYKNHISGPKPLYPNFS